MRMSELWADMQRPPILPSDEEVRRAGEKMLRDQFAIAALPGVINRASRLATESIADDCYKIADAMLAAREAK